jgi:hypothetical protein
VPQSGRLWGAPGAGMGVALGGLRGAGSGAVWASSNGIARHQPAPKCRRTDNLKNCKTENLAPLPSRISDFQDSRLLLQMPVLAGVGADFQHLVIRGLLGRDRSRLAEAKVELDRSGNQIAVSVNC